MGENKKDKIKVTEIDIVITDAHPCHYAIKYKEDGKSDYDVGYGSYDMEQVIRWRVELFEIVKKEEKENSAKYDVTNKELLKHLEDVKASQGVIANAINVLFSMIDSRKEKLELNKREMRLIRMTQVVMALVSEKMKPE